MRTWFNIFFCIFIIMIYDDLHILDLDKKATLEDIKRAYRMKAKELHPDLNKGQDAHMEFIRLQQAFDNLTRYFYYYRNRQYRSPGNTTTRAGNSYTTKYYTYSRFQSSTGEKAGNEYRNRKKDGEYDFRDSRLGKSIYIFFHVIFLIAGCMTVFYPVNSVVTRGFEPDIPIVSAILALFFSIVFGTVFIIAILLSGLNLNYRFR